MGKLSRRDFLRMAGGFAAGTMLVACQPKPEGPAEQVAKETPTAAKEAPPPAEEPITIVYWHGWGGRFGEWVDRIAAQFHEDNPDIVIEPLIVAWDELYPKLLTAVAAGTPPDTKTGRNDCHAPSDNMTMVDPNGLQEKTHLHHRRGFLSRVGYRRSPRHGISG